MTKKLTQESEYTMENFELINVDIDKQGEQVISGRKLHEFLEIKTRYKQWFDYMLKYGFEENVAFITITEKCAIVNKEIKDILQPKPLITAE